MMLVIDLRTLIVVTHADGAILVHAARPKALKGGGAGHGIVGEEKPETEDRLGQDVKNGVGNDLSIHIDVARTISDTPDTDHGQYINSQCAGLEYTHIG